MDLIGRFAAAVALAASLSACAAREGVPRPFPGAALPPTRTPDPVAEGRPEGHVPEAPDAPPAGTESSPGRAGVEAGTLDVVAMALGYRGVPYRLGGSDPAGFDCSGFVQYVFKQVGALLPRQVWEQFAVGREIDREDVLAGDLVFFQTVSKGASHVGLAIGDGQFIHAPSTNGVVRVERLASSYWAPRFVGARRVVSVKTATTD